MARREANDEPSARASFPASLSHEAGGGDTLHAMSPLLRAGACLGLVGALVACGSGGASGGHTSSSGGGSTGASQGGSAATGESTNGTGGKSGTGGSGGAGGSASGGGGSSGLHCKRGIASNTPPGAAFSPVVSWWYDWALQGSGEGAGIEFDPMVWGKASLGAAIPSGSKFLLGFNEPAFFSQANLTPQQAAADWSMVEAQAAATGAAIVSPAMTFCGPANQCNGTDPYQYLKDFFTACQGCKVDYVAVHWYNCDLASLQDYLEPGGQLAGFEQFGKPIWLTEFSCNSDASEADQEFYMRAVIPYLEGKANVYRYSWFSADPIPNGKLVNADGSPTPLGQVYLSLPQTCH